MWSGHYNNLGMLIAQSCCSQSESLQAYTNINLEVIGALEFLTDDTRATYEFIVVI